MLLLLLFLNPLFLQELFFVFDGLVNKFLRNLDGVSDSVYELFLSIKTVLHVGEDYCDLAADQPELLE